ncbi:MAG: biotin attachment protein [Solirubrobacterales bacterium]|nr:biotin attachment protein [Solirubrobacterales bacterium]
MAEVEVRLPQWGMGMEDGTIVEWLKAEGDTVEVGDELAEVELAKANEMLESPAAGTLLKIVAEPGETVLVREVIAIIESPS